MGVKGGGGGFVDGFPLVFGGVLGLDWLVGWLAAAAAGDAASMHTQRPTHTDVYDAASMHTLMFTTE